MATDELGEWVHLREWGVEVFVRESEVMAVCRPTLKDHGMVTPARVVKARRAIAIGIRSGSFPLPVQEMRSRIRLARHG